MFVPHEYVTRKYGVGGRPESRDRQQLRVVREARRQNRRARRGDDAC